MGDGCVVVTGASRGIGRAIALQFAKEGRLVVCVYAHQEAAAAAVVEEAMASGGSAVAMACDVGNEAAVEALFARIGDTVGPVEVLVNNAGISHYALVQETSFAVWRQLFSVHVDGTFLCTRAVLPQMLQRQNGVIINMSSIWGSRGAAMESAYSACKGAIEAFTKAVAQEVAYSGIRVNAIAPGVVATGMFEALTEEDRAQTLSDIPAGRAASPEEIAAYASFLASDACTYMTGQVLSPSGGFVI